MVAYVALFFCFLLLLVGLSYVVRLLLVLRKKGASTGDPLLETLEISAAERNLASAKVIGILIYATAFLGLIWFLFFYEPKPEYKLTADELYQEFVEDKAKANLKYRDNIVLVTGKYVGRERVFGSPAILLETSSISELVQCNFEGDRAEQAESLVLDQTVRLVGRVLGKTQHVTIEKCSVYSESQ